MARIQPVLTPSEIALVDQMAELTQSKRTLEDKGSRLGPEELGLLAKQLATASSSGEARIRERLTRGFYGVYRQEVPMRLN